MKNFRTNYYQNLGINKNNPGPGRGLLIQLKAPEPKCPKCKGKGFIGYNSTTKLPIHCQCRNPIK